MPGQIHVPISVAVQGLDKALKSLGRIGGVVKTAAAAFVTLTGAAQTSGVAMSTIEGAKALERNLEGLKTVFGDTTPQLEAFGRSASDLGLTMSEAAKATTFIGSVLKQSGFEIQETADLTERLVSLGADLALTYGYDVQEALLGMTALFRGEYDPIEKFGVAMKQSEIDAEKLARGLGHLTGAEERLADQQIRVEFLFDRAADAMGAVERQSGNLAVQQMRLRAEFENVRDTVAESLLPVVADFTFQLRDLVQEIGPKLKQVFDDMAPAIERVMERALPLIERLAELFVGFIGFIVDLTDIITDPFSKLGEQLVRINGLFLGTIEAITGVKVDGESTFNGLVSILEVVAIAAYAVLDALSQIAIWLDTFAEKMGAAFDAASQVGDDTIEGFFQKINFLLNSIGPAIDETNNLTTSLIGTRDSFVDSYVAAAQFTEELRLAKQSLQDLGDQTEIWDVLSGRVFSADDGAGGGGTGGGAAAAKDYIGDFFGGLEDEVRKQTARIQLQGMGLTEGLIESILGSKGWEKIFNKVISGGKEALEELKRSWANTKKGIDEATKAAEEFAKAQQEALEAATKEAEEFIATMQEAADKAEDAYNEALEKMQDFRKSMEETSRVSILPNAKEELGEFEQAVKSSMASIQSELISGFENGIILEQDLGKLQAFVSAEEFELRRLAQLRDDLANRFTLSEALINEYRRALTGAFSLTSLLGEIKSATETRIVTEVEQGVVKFGKSLRDFQVTVTREYEETVETVQNKSRGILENFRDMADKARLFGENLRKLKALGLDPMLFNQLIEAGVEAGGETAQALVDGGDETINEINALFKEIDQIGADLGEDVAATLYGAGIDMSDGLLEGIKSKQDEMYELARTMAQTFSENFKADLDIAIDKPVRQAEEAMEAAKEAVPDIQQINVQAIADLQAIINDANTALAGQLSTAFRTGITEKKFGAMALKEDLMRGIASGIGDITGGMTSADFRSAALATGGQIVNNYYVELNASSRAGGAKAGEAFKEALDKFESVNGNF